MEQVQDWLSFPWARAGAIFVGSFVVAFIFQVLFRTIVLSLVGRTKTDLDDKIAQALRRPIHWSVVFAGLAWALREAPLSSTVVGHADSTLKTLAIIVWAFSVAEIGRVVFGSFARNAEKTSLVQPRTQPLFDIFSKVALFAVASYGILLAWSINIGAWMASAGIAGIAIGFAAKDSLSNLFAGILIIVDAPYSLGDFIVLDGELRGAVTAIGFRSTRLLTLDDIEIVVPNSLIGNAQIVNESGGPYNKARVAVKVECAYGSDVDKVKEILIACADGAPHVSPEHQPMVRFSSFGASGLVHELLVWIEMPRYRELVVDDLNRRIYKAFGRAGIEIPYSKHDVFIKQFDSKLPALVAAPAALGSGPSRSKS